jgi:hypothetical protein
VLAVCYRSRAASQVEEERAPVSSQPPDAQPTPPPAPDERVAPDTSASEAILPFGDRLDEIAQDRFNRTDWIELAAAVILALATIVAAWSAYQATRWGGEQAKASRSAIEARTAAAQETTAFGAQAVVDVQLWVFWLEQAQMDTPENDNSLALAFIEERFRDEFIPAFDAWLAQVPEGEIPPARPFDMAEYQPAARVEAERLNALSDEFAEVSAEANQTGDNFVLTAVIMASVLFFAGVGTKLKGRGVRLFMLLVAALFFLGGLGFMLSLPQNVAI